jgi:hypothetical protein
MFNALIYYNLLIHFPFLSCGMVNDNWMIWKTFRKGWTTKVWRSFVKKMVCNKCFVLTYALVIS